VANMKRASGCIHHVEIIISVLGKLPLPFLEWPIYGPCRLQHCKWQECGN